MNEDLLELLYALHRGQLTPEQALRDPRLAQESDLGGVVLDEERDRRCGIPEIVYGEGKTVEQIISILLHLRETGRRGLVTRVSRDKAAEVQASVPDGVYSAASRLLMSAPAGETPLPDPVAGPVWVVSAGTSDLPVAEEAASSAQWLGLEVCRAWDVGVAGLHRIVSRIDALREARVVIVVAGMEGALPSVVAGLIASPVIAVPTSVGYGANLGGIAALLGMLNSCSGGVAVVNIDNGVGAAMLARRILLGAQSS